jgi:hypothetical protein
VQSLLAEFNPFAITIPSQQTRGADEDKGDWRIPGSDKHYQTVNMLSPKGNALTEYLIIATGKCLQNSSIAIMA